MANEKSLNKAHCSQKDDIKKGLIIFVNVQKVKSQSLLYATIFPPRFCYILFWLLFTVNFPKPMLNN